MTQSDFGTIDPNTKNGTELASDLNTFRDALNTLHRGSSLPSYAQGGTLWINDAGGPTAWVLNIYDGSDSITLFTIDTSANTVTISFSTIDLTTTADVKMLDVTRNKTGGAATTDLVLIEDIGDANNLSSIRTRAHRPGIVFEDITPGDHFRVGVDANLLKISIDTDNDLAKDASGHFDDIPNAVVIDGPTGWVGLGTATIQAELDIRSASPALLFVETDAAADNQMYEWVATGESFGMLLWNDARSVSTNPILITRTGTNVDVMVLTADVIRTELGDQIGLGTDSPNATTLHVVGNGADNGNGTTSQLMISGSGDLTKTLNLGYDTTNDHAFVQSVDHSTAFKPLEFFADSYDFKIGSTDKLNIDSSGNVTFAGDWGDPATGRNKNWSQYIPVAAMAPITSSIVVPITFAAGDTVLPVSGFDAAGDEVACASFQLPADYGGESFWVDIYWSSSAGGSVGNVVWRVWTRGFNNSDTLTTAHGVNTYAAASSSSLQDFIVSGKSIAISAAAAGQDLMSFYIQRNGSSGSDTMGGDAFLIGVRIRYSA